MYFMIARASKIRILLLTYNLYSLLVVGDRLAAKPSAQHATTAARGFMIEEISEDQRGRKIQNDVPEKVRGTNVFIIHGHDDHLKTEVQLLMYRAGVKSDLVLDGKNRARQNVILEIGYFLGQLGKARVRMIVKEDIDIPSDLHGVLYQRYDQQGAWKSKLMKEMLAVGIFVDMKAVIESL